MDLLLVRAFSLLPGAGAEPKSLGEICRAPIKWRGAVCQAREWKAWRSIDLYLVHPTHDHRFFLSFRPTFFPRLRLASEVCIYRRQASPNSAEEASSW